MVRLPMGFVDSLSEYAGVRRDVVMGATARSSVVSSLHEWSRA